MNNIKSWREVITPAPEITNNTYKNAEFMADLGLAAEGTGGVEYTDAAEFFRRTYITAGLKALLVKAAKRVCGFDGEPVLQLKTAFGGGKTHSMLALYHLMNSSASLEGMQSVRDVMKSAGVFGLPAVNVAVLACTHLNAAEPMRVCGLNVNTLWGNLAAQLGGYDYVREADAKSVPPGSDALRKMFDEKGPCIVLIDELVAYARTLPEREGIVPAGTIDSFLTFIQQLTEAAISSRNSLVAATLPESEMELGGEKGLRVLHAVEHIFARVESVWKPITAGEGFEIVRRRLFLDCKDIEARDRTAEAFSSMYMNNLGYFPPEAREASYRERIIACYPFHPELFDRLYSDWATLEKFQRTRGVLRLMSAVIHRLWTGGDNSALIMPGSLPLYDSAVREGLIRALPEHDAWNPIVEHDIDGEGSRAFILDAKDRFAQVSAARRTARTIMLGSAPAGRDKPLRGIESERVRLGTVQPGENISTYNDALNDLKSELSYLYADNSDNRLWFDTRPTLRKIAQERRQNVKDSAIEEEITRRLRRLMRNKRPFAGVHVFPRCEDVPDDENVRLVVLGLYGTRDSAFEIWNKHGTNDRLNRNMLLFLAADDMQVMGLKDSVRSYLAWKSIETSRESLNLDVKQIREVSRSLEKLTEDVDDAVRRTWCVMLSPRTVKGDRVNVVDWKSARLTVSEDMIDAAIRTAEDERYISTKWGAMHMNIELQNIVWDKSDDVRVKDLWEYVCRYCYMPRLSGYDVLEAGIAEGVMSGEFAIADDRDGETYTNLRINESVSVRTTDYVVKKGAVSRQLNAEKVIADEEPEPEAETTSYSAKPEPQRTKRRFHMHTNIEASRFKRTAQTLYNDVISLLQETKGAEIRITLEVNMDTTTGIDDELVKAISFNCSGNNITDYFFDE